MPELVVGQAGKELTHNQALAVLDQLAQAVVVDKDLTAPPGSPANGSMYIVAAGATGAWSGQSGKLAYWLTTVAAWTFITPADGWYVWVTDEGKRYELVSGAWTVVSSGSGGSGDMLSALLSSEVPVTGETTLTASAFGKMHVCSGTASNYALTLPNVSGNAGKFIGVRMSSALTNIVTVSSSALIDGMPARYMWAGESAILLCDGASWTKIAGKSIPMTFKAKKVTSDQSIPSHTLTKITITDTEFNTGAVFSAANSRADIRRPATWSFSGGVNVSPCEASKVLIVQINKNSASAAVFASMHTSSTVNLSGTGSSMLGGLAAGDQIDLNIAATFSTNATTYATALATALQGVEVLDW